MMAELTLIAKATLILVVALFATRTARRARASVRSLILSAAFGLVLVLPIASAVAPAREVQIPEVYATRFLITDETVDQRADLAAPPQRSAAAPSSGPWRLPPPEASIRLAWLLGTLVTLLPLVRGLWRLRDIRRRAHSWPAGRELIDVLRESVGVRRTVAVVLHDGLATPMTCGWLRPTIAMPADAPGWPASDVRQALLHELEHVRRQDWPVHILARLTCSLYWFHPVAWIAWRQLSLDSERACDDAVVTQAEQAAYAEQLLSLARRLSRGRAAPLLSMADRRTLSTRIASILSNTVARGRVGALAAALVLTGAAGLAAAIAPVQAVGAQTREPELAVPTSADGPAFEVASIRRNNESTQGQTITLKGNTFVAQNVTVRDLLLTAFRVRADQMSGGPGWIDSERYDVYGRPTREASWEQQLLMVQRLLADRFTLAIRREIRQVPAYALVAGRNGPKLKAASECVASSAGPRCGGFTTRPGSIVGRSVSVAQVAALLSSRSGRTVVNKTAIEGSYDVNLVWTPDVSQLPPGPAPDDAPPIDQSGPSLFTALEEQLGLKLEPTMASVEHLVIEDIERPTPNDAPQLPGPQGVAGGKRSFEVASVRENKSGSPISRGPMIQPGNRFVAQNVMARVLMTTAYGLRHEQVVGGPAWLDTDTWDIEARARENASLDDVHAMLRTLLEERFGLVARRESRQQDLYALVAAGGGRKTPGLRPAANPCAPLRLPTRLPAVSPDSVGGFDSEPTVTLGNTPKCERRYLPGFIGASQITMPEFAEAVTMFARRHVVDRTGFKGEFDIDLTFAPDMGPAATPGDFAPLGTALQEQLGLKLEAARGPVDVLVIDRANRPAGN